MALKYARITNESSNEYEILIHGVVGKDFTGHEIAKEIKLLNDLGATRITERINSAGGSVHHGYSIVAANLQSRATIATLNEGNADSMSLLVLASGDVGHREAYDYATGVIHDPLMGNVTLDKIEDVKLRGIVGTIKNSLVKILENNTGKHIDEISAAMSEDLMLTSSQLLEFGIIDKIRPSKKQPIISPDASVYDRIAACTELINEQEDKMNFESKYNEATNQVSELSGQVENLTAEKTELMQEVENLKAELEPFKAKVAEMEAEQRKNYVDKAINTGVWEESDRETLENLAANDFEGFKKTVDSVKAPQLRATDIINLNDREDEDEDDTRSWNFSDWERNDPAGLLEMRFTNSALYNKLKEEDDKQYQTA